MACQLCKRKWETYDTILKKISDKLMSDYGIGLKRAREIAAFRDEISYSKAIYEVVDSYYK